MFAVVEAGRIAMTSLHIGRRPDRTRDAGGDIAPTTCLFRKTLLNVLLQRVTR